MLILKKQLPFNSKHKVQGYGWFTLVYVSFMILPLVDPGYVKVKKVRQSVFPDFSTLAVPALLVVESKSGSGTIGFCPVLAGVFPIPLHTNWAKKKGTSFSGFLFFSAQIWDVQLLMNTLSKYIFFFGLWSFFPASSWPPHKRCTFFGVGW